MNFHPATIAFAVYSTLMLLWLYRRNKNPKSKINLDDLILDEDGRISKVSLVMYIALIVSSHIIWLQAVRKTLTDLTFGAYLAAWVVPTLTKTIAGKLNSPKPDAAGTP